MALIYDDPMDPAPPITNAVLPLMRLLKFETPQRGEICVALAFRPGLNERSEFSGASSPLIEMQMHCAPKT